MAGAGLSVRGHACPARENQRERERIIEDGRKRDGRG